MLAPSRRIGRQTVDDLRIKRKQVVVEVLQFSNDRQD